MKKLLSIIGGISLITSGSSNLMGCNKTKNSKKNEDFNKIKHWAPQQPPENSNWKLLIEGESEKINHILKTYIGLKLIGKTWFINTWKGKQLKPDTWKIFGISSIYRWDGVGEPEKPTVNPNTGEITDWK